MKSTHISMDLKSKKYFGKIEKQKLLDNYYLTLTTYKNCQELPFHRHKNPYLSINIGSVYKEISKTTEKAILPGEAILRPAHYIHRNIFSKQNRCCLNLEIIDFSKSDVELAVLFSDVRVRTSGMNLFKLVTAFLTGYREDEMECLIQEVLLDEYEMKKENQKPEWYCKIISRIQEDYDSTLTLKILADTAHVHPNYLARKFKYIEGMTIGEYIRKIRAERAFIQLISSENNLTEIGFKTGFYDQAHFSRTFSNVFGTNPNHIRSVFKKLL